MGQLIVAQCSAFSVLEPLLANLIASDVKIPYLRRDTFKILVLVDIGSMVSFVAHHYHGVGKRIFLQLAYHFDGRPN